MVAAISALAGGAFWGLFHLATTILAGQPVGWSDTVRAVANVIIGIFSGSVMAYYIAPAIAKMIPFTGLKDLHAIGFGIGAVAWEAAPFIYRAINSRVTRMGRSA